MRKIILTSLAATTLMLGGCTTGYDDYGGYGGGSYGGGYGGGAGAVGAILGSVLGGGLGGSGYGSGYGSGSEQFQRAAIDACGNQASRYGQVSISDVQQTSRDYVRVDGRIGTNYQQRGFTCTFASNGRIADFRMG